MTDCKFCGIEIFWNDIDGKMIPFEDQNGTIFHRCPKLKKQYVEPNLDHILLTQTITRVSQLEHMMEQIKEIMDKNGLHFQWRQ